MRKLTIRLFTCIALVLLPAPPAPAGNVDGEAERTLRTLAESKDLAMSFGTPGGPAGPEAFSFTVRLRPPAGEPTDILVERRGASVALLARSPAGLPYLYATDRLLAKLDPASPGSLIVRKGARFLFVAASGANGHGLDFQVSFDRMGDQGSTVRFDPGSILRSLLPASRQATVDPTTGAITVDTPNTRVVVEGPAAQRRAGAAAFPIAALAISPKGRGSSLAFTDLRAASPDVSITGFTAEQFESLTIPKSVEAWREGAMRDQAMIPPEGFWKDPRNVQAAEQVARLLRGDAAAKPAGGADAAAPQPPAHGQAAGEDIDEFRRGALKALDAVTAALRDAKLTEAQQGQVDRAIADHRARIDATAEQLRQEKITPRAALAEAARIARITDDLRRVLAPRQFAQFARAWLAQPAPPATPDPMRDVLSTVLAGAVQMDISDQQQAQMGQLFVGLMRKSDDLRAAVLTGQADKDEVRRATGSLSRELVSGLQRILTAEQYKQLETLIQAEIQKRPAESKADQRSQV